MDHPAAERCPCHPRWAVGAACAAGDRAVRTSARAAVPGYHDGRTRRLPRAGRAGWPRWPA